MLTLVSSVKKSHHNYVQLRDNSRYVTLITATVMVICLHYTILFEIGMMQPIVIIELAPLKRGKVLYRGRSVHKRPVIRCVDCTWQHQHTPVESLLFKITSNEAKQTSCLQKTFDDFGGRMPKNNERFGIIWQCIKIIIYAN